MPEFETSHEDLEVFRVQIGEGIDNILHIIVSGQDTDMPVDTFTLRLSDTEEPALSHSKRIVLRDTLYNLVGRSTVEKAIPVTTYQVGDNGENTIIVSVYKGNYPHPETEDMLPVFLHETVDLQGGYSWVISSSAEVNPFFKGDESYQPVEKYEPPVKDEILERATPTLEYALSIADLVKQIFPEYSGVLQDTFEKDGRICLYQEKANTEGLQMAINIIASPTNLGYILGYIEEKKGKSTFKYKNLPRIIETITRKGVQMDHPQTDWDFRDNEQEKRIKSFNEMENMLTLLRNHGEF